MPRRFYIQSVRVQRDKRSRLAFLRTVCRQRRVLHVGCADWPISNIQTSLHIKLDRVCRLLDGFDTRPEALAVLRPHVGGRLTDSWKTLRRRSYDVVIAPEVLEHVTNAEEFLRELRRIRSKRFILTVPDVYSCGFRRFKYDAENARFTEIVHPDHNYWFSPYTFKNLVTRCTGWKLRKMWFVGGMSLVGDFRKVPRRRRRKSPESP